MAVGVAQFIRVFSDSADHALWQNYWPGQFVDKYVFVPFSTSAISSSQSGVQETASITAPAIPLVFSLAQAATSSAWLVEISTYQFQISGAGSTPPASKALTSRFTGEVIGGSMSLETITLEIGSSVASGSVLVPAKRFTTSLIGRPPKL